MTDDQIEGFIESMLEDRAPKEFVATREDTGLLRVAIELRAVPSECAWPDEEFVLSLHQRLAGITDAGAELVPFPPGMSRRHAVAGRPRAWSSHRRSKRKEPRALAAVGKAAAAAFLVAGTFGATQLAGGHSQGASPQRVAAANTVRSGELLAADGRQLGETYAYRANPSWVFMSVQNSGLVGTYICELHLANGNNVMAGVLVAYNGSGDWAHTVNVDVSGLHSATLENSSGEVVATATFS